ncbi:MAG: hypothetical protein ABIW76_13410 [Fibrobacteria bacterium]
MSLRHSLIIMLSLLCLSTFAFAGNGQQTPSGNPAFAAAPAVSPVPDQGAYFAPFMRFDAAAGNLDVTFGIDQGARITLEAYDVQGKLLAILLDRNQGAGFHHLSLFSNQMQGYKGHMTFRLRSDHSVIGDNAPPGSLTASTR